MKCGIHTHLHGRTSVVTGACLGILVDKPVQKPYGCKVFQRIAGIGHCLALSRGGRGGREGGERGERGKGRERGREGRGEREGEGEREGGKGRERGREGRGG